MLAAALGLVLSGCAATGDGHPRDLPPAWRLADADMDRAVTLDEWDQSSGALFEQLDQDGSGALDIEELRRAFATLDRDGDGRIALDEARVIVLYADRDGDAKASPEEYGEIDWNIVAVDSDFDDLISLEEFRRGRRDIFTRVDRDGDKVLQPVELDSRARLTVFRF